MKYLIRLFSIYLLLLLSACNKTDLTPAIITMRVAEQYKDCVGVGPQKCLWVQIAGEPTWTLHYSGIEGFVYEEGYEYFLVVKRKRINNPPMDGSNLRYTLLKVVEKTKK